MKFKSFKISKFLSFFIGVIFLSNFTTTVYADSIININENINSESSNISDESFYNSIKDSTLQNLNNYFKNSLSEIQTQYSLYNSNNSENLNSEIESYKTLVDITNTISNEDFNNAKELLLSSFNESKSKSLEKSISSVIPASTVRGMIALVIKSGEDAQLITATRLLRHALVASYRSTYNVYNDNLMVSNRIKFSTDYKNLVNKISNDYKKSGKSSYSSKESLTFKNRKPFVDSDLYYAVHHCNGGVNVNINNGNGTLIINDLYDFPNLSWPTNASNILNDLGRVAMEKGIIHEYYVKFHVNQKFTAPTSSNNSGYSRVLKVTNPLMHGNDVKKVQNKLNQLGYNAGTADGYYGNNTKNAVIRFQKAKGISADGMVGPTTWNKLFSSSSSSSSSSNTGYSRVLKVTSPLMYGNDVKKVQNRLNQLGYNAGTADGYYGNNTKNAVIRFQKAKKISADGMVGPTTWNKLF
ncbi:peptidoglycan-binding protein (plasmid) [Clostridium baratii]